MIRATAPAGAVVPVHSHDERETFYVFEGKIEGLWENRWITLGVGDVFDVPGGLKHGRDARPHVGCHRGDPFPRVRSFQRVRR